MRKILLLSFGLFLLANAGGYAQKPSKPSMEEMKNIHLQKKAELRELYKSNSDELADTGNSVFSNHKAPERLIKNQSAKKLPLLLNNKGFSKGSEAYGFFIDPIDVPTYVKFDVDDYFGFTSVSTDLPDLYGGAYYNGYLYAYETVTNNWGDALEVYFHKIEAATGNIINTVPRPELWGNFVSALSYDYSEGVMYAMYNNGVNTVNLATGILTKIADINENLTLIVNMAIDIDGIMYIIPSGSEGILYTVNKTNGNITYIGHTGRYYVNYAQSMGFDYNEGKLYWNETNDYYEWAPYNFLEVNVETGEITILETDTYEVTSFHFPFTPPTPGAPSKVLNFTVTPGALGALNAVLNWTNPNTTFSGQPLNELTAIKIYENDILIHTVTNPVIGGAGTYTRTVTTSGIYNYKIIPENSEGDGVIAIAKQFIGIDVPGAPIDVTLIRDDNLAIVSWTAPTTGLNGGWFNTSTLTYSILRLPDNTLMTTGLTATSFTDYSIVELELYSYQITSVNNAGTGGTAISNKIMIGEALQIPYSMGFENHEKWELWTIVNDGVSGEWYREVNDYISHTGEALLMHDYNDYQPANDWIFSPQVKFGAGKNYKIRFWAKVPYNSTPEKLAIYIAYGQTPESVIGDAIWIGENMYNDEYVEFEIHLFDYSEGDYSIAFHCFSPEWSSLLYVDDFSISELADIDASATMLYGALSPMVGKQFKYKTVVRNEGLMSISGYSVVLKDESGIVLATNNTGAELAPGEKIMVDLFWTPTAAGNNSIYAETIMSGDEITANDASPALNITVQPDTNLFTGTIGSGEIIDWIMPFNFYYQSSRVQSIYFDHELIGQLGAIVEIQYFNSFETDLSNGSPVQIWIANTSQSQLDDWIPESEFTLVFEGYVEFPSGKNTIAIELDEPFVYEGQNLVIMTNRPMDIDYYSYYDRFYNTNTPDFPLRSLVYCSDWDEFNWTQQGDLSDLHPNTVLKMLLESGSVSGVVTDNDSNPLEGVMIQVEGSQMKRFTNEDGEYNFSFLVPGEYRFIAEKHGYFIEISDEITVVVNENKTVNFELTPIPKVNVFGNIKANDRPEGLDNVLVTLTGYDTFSAYSIENGDYLIENVYDGFTYTLTAKRAGYTTYIDDVEVDGDTEFDFTMNEVLFPPQKVIATVINDNYIEVEWFEPVTGIETAYILDDGIADGGYRVNPGVSVSLGNIYNVYENGFISSVDVYAESGGGISRLVTIDIYNEDRELVGSSEPFALPGDEWVNVELDFINYENVFYAMVNWSPVGGQTNYLGYDFDPINDYRHLSYGRESNGSWFDFGDESWYYGVFMIRVNALVSGKSVSYELNNNRAFVDYILYRLKKGQPENEWTTLLNNTLNLEYTDNGWNGFTWGEYQYAVKARYTGGVLSKAKFSNVLDKDMVVDYKIIVKTSTGASAEGAVVTLRNQNGNPNHVFTDIVADDGVITLPVRRGFYDLTVTFRGYQTLEEYELDITETGEIEVLLYEKIYPTGEVIAKYFPDDNNVIISWDPPGTGVQTTYIWDDGSAENGWRANPGYDGSYGNIYEVYEDGVITSIDLYSIFYENNSNKSLTVDIYDADRKLVGTSKPFILVTDKWVNVEIDNIPYSGTFYAMVHWEPTSGNTHYLACDQYGPYAFSDFSYAIHNGVWGTMNEMHWSQCVFMIRVNANSIGKSVSYSFNKIPQNEAIMPKGALDYHVYRLIPEQPEEEWIVIAHNLTDLTFTDENVSELPESIYQYAVRARYPGDFFSKARLSNIIDFNVNIIDKNLSNLILYPNPFKNEIYISNIDNIKSVEIFDIMGRKIQSFEVQSSEIQSSKLETRNFEPETRNYKVETSHFSNGVYFVLIESNTGEKAVYKMVKR